MKERRKVPVSMSKTLLGRLSARMRGGCLSRSSLMRTEAACRLTRLQKRRLKAGYRAMSALNRELAEEGVTSDNDSLGLYEQKLAECE